jgi:hypothetical protein
MKKMAYLLVPKPTAMNTKNYFFVHSIVNLLFGVGLIFLPGMMTDQYLADPAMRTNVTDFISRLLGVVVLAIALGLYLSSTAGPSPARKAFLIASLVANWGNVFVHVMAINEGIEKSFAWGTVATLGFMGIWGLLVLRSSK